MADTLVIIGAGGHGRVCADVARAAGFDVVGFCDTAKSRGEEVNGIRVLGAGLADLAAAGGGKRPAVFVAIGDNARRLALLDEAGTPATV